MHLISILTQCNVTVTTATAAASVAAARPACRCAAPSVCPAPPRVTWRAPAGARPSAEPSARRSCSPRVAARLTPAVVKKCTRRSDKYESVLKISKRKHNLSLSPTWVRYLMLSVSEVSMSCSEFMNWVTSRSTCTTFYMQYSTAQFSRWTTCFWLGLSFAISCSPSPALCRHFMISFSTLSSSPIRDIGLAAIRPVSVTVTVQSQVQNTEMYEQSKGFIAFFLDCINNYLTNIFSL